MSSRRVDEVFGGRYAHRCRTLANFWVMHADLIVDVSALPDSREVELLHRDCGTAGCSRACCVPARWRVSGPFTSLSDHGPNRLMADAQLGSEGAQTLGCGKGADRGLLL